LLKKKQKVASSGLLISGYDIDTIEKVKKFIEKELMRLMNPKLTPGSGNEESYDDSESFGYLQKKDFFDLLMLIQLKNKLKLSRDSHRK